MSSRLAILQQRSLVTALTRQVELRNAFGLAYYEPHHKQDLFHQAAEICKSRYGRTGNRFGKSTMGVAEVGAYAVGERPWYKCAFDVRDGKGRLIRRHDPENDAWMIQAGIPERNQKILIITTDWGKAEEVFTNQTDGDSKGKIFKLLGDRIVGVDREHGNVVRVLVQSKWGGHSSINFDTVQSFKREKLSQESSNWDVILVDEPCPEKMFEAVARGLVDTGGCEMFTCTPLTEMWINDYFLPKGNIRDSFELPNVETISVPCDDQIINVRRWMITGSMHDNPVLKTEDKARFISKLSKDVQATRIEGRPSNLAGVVYPEFKREVHVYDKSPNQWKGSFDVPPANYTIRIAIDCHDSTPQTVLFAATAPDGHVFFFSEYFEKVYIKQVCEAINVRVQFRPILRKLIDLRAYNKNAIDGVTIADEFQSNGIEVEPATKDLTYGIQRVREELMRTDLRGHAMLQFSPHLTETLREFDRYVYDPDTGKPRDQDDHMMECLYRLVLTGLEYVEPDTISKAEPIKPLVIATNINKKLPMADVTSPFLTYDSRKRSRKTPGDYRVTSIEERRAAALYRHDG